VCATRARLCAVPIAVVLAALVAAAPAWAHGRNPTVALDYRVTLRSVPPGIHVAILDGDRGLKLSLEGARTATVLGDLREAMLRFGSDGVFVNRRSPTAQADRIIRQPAPGWHRVAAGDVYTWHEHRLAPPPFASGPYGPVASWSVPVVVDGRRGTLGGRFVRVERPRWWLWLGATVLAVAVAVLACRTIASRVGLAVALASVTVAGIAAAVCQTAFALRDSTTGRLSPVGFVVFAMVAVGGIALIAFNKGYGRAYVAGGIGAGIAALTLPWVGVFFHGLVISALPATVVRVTCALAFGAGLVALAASLTVRE
jgi:hypothetical protein